MTETFHAEVSEDERNEEAAAIKDINAIYELRQAASSMEAGIKLIDPSASDRGKMGRLRRWLLDHDSDLYDGEHGLVAWLQSGGETFTYDTALSIKEHDGGLYQRLWEVGALKVDPERVKEAIRDGLILAGDLEPYRHKSQRSLVLKVDKAENRRGK